MHHWLTFTASPTFLFLYLQESELHFFVITPLTIVTLESEPDGALEDVCAFEELASFFLDFPKSDISRNRC